MEASTAPILRVEDHEDTRLVALALTIQKYQVKTAGSVSEALKLAADEDFSLFIFDSLRRDGSGVDLCRTVREFDQQTPIVFYSGLAFEHDKVSSIGAGAQAYLVKPVEMSDLINSVRQLISNSDGDGA